jgi:hypothetical protein
MAHDARQLGEQGPQPGRTLWHLHPDQSLDSERRTEFVGERRDPVVAVGEHESLAVVAHLEQFLDAAMEEADLGFAGDDPVVAVKDQVEPQGSVSGGMVRADGEASVAVTRSDSDAERPAQGGTGTGHGPILGEGIVPLGSRACGPSGARSRSSTSRR